jgi:L-alanine-DL-glutamate epimerase-like enolase superfamily enzyme
MGTGRIVAAAVAATTVDDGRAFPTRYGAGLAARPHAYVRLSDDEGRTGDGEASPLPHFTGETVPGVVAALDVLLPLIIGCETLALGDLAERLARHPQNPAAKCAIEMAAHDLAARTLGISLAAFLGGEDGATIPSTGLIGIVPDDEAVALAQDYLAEGIGTFKMKVGRDPSADVRRVAAVRAAAGPAVAIRLDANAGLPLPDVLALLRGLERRDIAIELFEQPVRADDLRGLRTVREVGIRVLVDESVHGPRDAVRLLEAGACDLIAIKLIKCGGLRAAATIARLAAEYDVGCILISPYETAVGMATTAHVAAALGTRAHAQDLFRHLSPGGGSWAHSAVPGGLQLAVVAGHGATVEGEVDHQLAAQLRAARGVAAR